MSYVRIWCWRTLSDKVTNKQISKEHLENLVKVRSDVVLAKHYWTSYGHVMSVAAAACLIPFNPVVALIPLCYAGAATCYSINKNRDLARVGAGWAKEVRLDSHARAGDEGESSLDEVDEITTFEELKFALGKLSPIDFFTMAAMLAWAYSMIPKKEKSKPESKLVRKFINNPNMSSMLAIFHAAVHGGMRTAETFVTAGSVVATCECVLVSIFDTKKLSKKMRMMCFPVTIWFDFV